MNKIRFFGSLAHVDQKWWGKECKTEADYSTQTLTPVNLTLCDWGRANIAEHTAANVIGQNLVNLFKRRAANLDLCPTVYSMVGHV